MNDIENALETKFCIDCKKFINNGHIWYDQFCGEEEVKAPRKTDPVTGKILYSKKNDLGGEYFDDHPHPYARDINNGNCKFFDKK